MQRNQEPRLPSLLRLVGVSGLHAAPVLNLPVGPTVAVGPVFLRVVTVAPSLVLATLTRDHMESIFERALVVSGRVPLAIEHHYVAAFGPGGFRGAVIGGERTVYIDS
jgi:hypothetical protein